MNLLRVGRVTIAWVAFAVSVEALGQPTDDGTNPESPGTTVPEAVVPEASSPPAPLVTPTPLVESTRTPTPEEKKSFATPPPSLSTSYPNKWLKPHRLARHYGPFTNFHWDVTGYGTFGFGSGVNDSTGGYAFGVRTNFDIGFVAIFGQYERLLGNQKGYSTDLHQGKLMVGFIPVTTPYGRLRILTGFDIMSRVLPGGELGKVTVSPAIGISGRLGNGLFGLEASGLIGIYPMFQAEARLAFVARLTFVQFHVGYQVLYRSSAPGTAPGVTNFVGNATDEFLNGLFMHGPQAGIGFGW